MGLSMFDNYYAVIMAGGGGTRLWPLSRKSQPKQMLQLLEERSLFQISVDRLDGLFPPERIIVVTVEEQAQELREHCPSIPRENFLLEPKPRGTASVIGLASIALKHRNPQAVMAVLTSDHYIGNEDGFRKILESGFKFAMDGYLVTLGISPTYAATGYGYIQQGEQIGKLGDHDIYQALRFKEKPGPEQALAMLASGDHTWNSGMFIWRVDRIMGEFAEQMPDLFRKMEDIDYAWDTVNQSQVLERIWPNIKSETIDYGIMEKAQNVVVIPAKNLQWNDVGSWESLFSVLPSDANGNIVMGEKYMQLDSHDTLIYSSRDERLVVTIGIEDLVIVDTDDVLLVCHRDRAQDVRQIVKQLKENRLNYA